jgi:hypothetical protein
MQKPENPLLQLMQDIQLARITILGCSLGAVHQLKQGDFPLGS